MQSVASVTIVLSHFRLQDTPNKLVHGIPLWWRSRPDNNAVLQSTFMPNKHDDKHMLLNEDEILAVPIDK